MERLIRGLTWPSGDGTAIEPGHATEAGRRLNFAGDDVTALRDGLGAEIEGDGNARPWGADDIGAAFQKSYAEMAPLVLKIWRQAGVALERMGANVQDAARSVVATDRSSAARVERAGDHHPDLPL